MIQFRAAAQAGTLSDDDFDRFQSDIFQRIDELETRIVNNVGARARVSVILPEVASRPASMVPTTMLPTGSSSMIETIDGEEVEIVNTAPLAPLAEEEIKVNPIKVRVRGGSRGGQILMTRVRPQ